MTFAIQDGSAAGQTVPHVHVHVIPRRAGDFTSNDEVYDELDKANMHRGIKVDAEEDRKSRTKENMYSEAAELRALFPDSTVPQ